MSEPVVERGGTQEILGAGEGRGRLAESGTTGARADEDEERHPSRRGPGQGRAVVLQTHAGARGWSATSLAFAREAARLPCLAPRPRGGPHAGFSLHSDGVPLRAPGGQGGQAGGPFLASSQSSPY